MADASARNACAASRPQTRSIWRCACAASRRDAPARVGPCHHRPDCRFPDNFWILDQRTAQLFQTEATLRLVTDHAYWFVESDLADEAPQADLERSAARLRNADLPAHPPLFRLRAVARRVDGDPHIVFLLGNVPGVAAYFSSADAYPRAINPRSNEHEMIYVNLNSLRPGQTGFDSTITHEFQHMAHFAHCPNQEGWVDEGASELAMRVAGYEGALPLAFATHPDVQLNAWRPAGRPRAPLPGVVPVPALRRRARRRLGRAAARLLATCARGEGLFASFLANDPIAPDLDSLFARLDRGQPAAGRLGRPTAATCTPTADFTPPSPARASRDDAVSGLGAAVRRQLRRPAARRGHGHVQRRLHPCRCWPRRTDAGGVWWSNRGDSLDTRLTRHVDLTRRDRRHAALSAPGTTSRTSSTSST